MAEVGEHPAAATLHPHTLVGGIDLAGTIKAGIYTAVDGIHTVFQPKIGDGVQLTADPGPLGRKSLMIHKKNPLYFL